MKKIQPHLIDSLDFSSISNIFNIPTSKKVINITNCTLINSILDFLTSNAEKLPENIFVLIFNIQEPKVWTFERQKLQTLSEVLKNSESERIFVFQSKFRSTKFLCKIKNQTLLTKIELSRNLHEDEFTNSLITNELIFKAVVMSRVEAGICGVYDYSFSSIIFDTNRHFLGLKLIDYALINFDSISLKFLQLFGNDLSLANESGNRPLETAVKCGNFCGFLELLGESFEVLTLLHQPTGFNLLMLAAENGNPEILHYLLELDIFDVNFCVNEKTALKLAKIEKKFEAVATLLEHDAKYDEEVVNNFTEDVKELHKLVAKKGDGHKNEEEIKKIIQKYPKTRNFFDSNGQSAIKTAIISAIEENIRVVEGEYSSRSGQSDSVCSHFIEFLLINGLRMGKIEEFSENLASKSDSLAENPIYCDYIHKILSKCVIKCDDDHLKSHSDKCLYLLITSDLQLLSSTSQMEIADQSNEAGQSIISRASFDSEATGPMVSKYVDLNSSDEADDADFELIDNSDTESLVNQFKQSNIDGISAKNSVNSTNLDKNQQNSKQNCNKMLIDALKLLNNIPETKILLEIFGLYENIKIILNLSDLSLEIKENWLKLSIFAKSRKDSMNSIQMSDNLSTFDDSYSEVSSLRQALQSFDIISSASSTSGEIIDDDVQSVRSIKSDRTLNSFSSFENLSVVSENFYNSSVCSDFEEIEPNFVDCGSNFEGMRSNLVDFDQKSVNFGQNSTNFSINLENLDQSSSFSDMSLSSKNLTSKLNNLSLKSENLEDNPPKIENFAQNVVEHVFNFVIFKIFDNNFKPHFQYDSESEIKLTNLVEEIHQKNLNGEIDENVIKNIFKNYDSQYWGRNLVACVPKMCAFYAKNDEKLQESRQKLQILFEFYKNLMFEFRNYLSSLKVSLNVAKLNKMSKIVEEISKISNNFNWINSEKFKKLRIFDQKLENQSKYLQILLTNSSILTMIQIFQEKSENFLIFVDFENFLNEKFQKEIKELLKYAYLVLSVDINDNLFENHEVLLNFSDKIIIVIEIDDVESINEENIHEKFWNLVKNCEKFEVRLQNEVKLPSSCSVSPNILESSGNFEVMNSTKSEVKLPNFEVMFAKSEVKLPNFEVISPKSEVKLPNFEVMSAKSEVKLPSFEVMPIVILIMPQKFDLMSQKPYPNLKIQILASKLSHKVSDFQENTKRYLLERKVDFQGNLIKFSDIISIEILNEMDEKSFKTLIDNKNILKIGKKFINTEKFYFDRRFVDSYYIYVAPKLQYVPKVESTKFFTELLQQKIILLCDEPGMGKTTTLKQLYFKFKEIFPTNWIIYVDLKRHGSIYEDFKNVQKWSYENFTEFFTKIQSLTEFESKIFHQLLLAEKVIFLIDGVDEITQKHKDFIINFTKDLYKITKCYLWIGMRPYCINEYRGAFSIFAYHLEPVDPNKFLDIYVKSQKIPENEEKDLRAYVEKFKKFNKSCNNPLFISIVLDIYDELGTNLGFYMIYEKYVWKKFGIHDGNDEVRPEISGNILENSQNVEERLESTENILKSSQNGEAWPENSENIEISHSVEARPEKSVNMPENSNGMASLQNSRNILETFCYHERRPQQSGYSPISSYDVSPSGIAIRLENKKESPKKPPKKWINVEFPALGFLEEPPNKIAKISEDHKNLESDSSNSDNFDTYSVACSNVKGRLVMNAEQPNTQKTLVKYSEGWPQKQVNTDEIAKKLEELPEKQENSDKINENLGVWPDKQGNIDKIFPKIDLQYTKDTEMAKKFKFNENMTNDPKKLEKILKNALRVLELFQKHQKIAMKKFTLYLKHFSYDIVIKEVETKFTDDEIVELSSYGIIYGTTDDQIFFIHQTFYEFFVASFIVGQIFEGPELNDQRSVYSRIFQIMFSYTEFEVIAKFINFYVKDNEDKILARKNEIFKYVMRNVSFLGAYQFSDGSMSAFNKNICTLLVKKHFNLAKITLKLFKNEEEVARMFEKISQDEYISFLDVGKFVYSSNDTIDYIMLFKEAFRDERQKIIFKYFLFESSTFLKDILSKLSENGAKKFFQIFEEIFSEDELKEIFKGQIGEDEDGSFCRFLNLIHQLNTDNLTSKNLEVLMKFSNKFLNANQKFVIMQNFADNLEISTFKNQNIFVTLVNFTSILEKSEIREILTQNNSKLSKIFLNFVSKKINFSHFHFLLQIISENLKEIDIFNIIENDPNLKIQFFEACCQNLSENIEIFTNFVDKFLPTQKFKDFLLQKGENCQFSAVHFLFQNYQINFERIFSKIEIKNLILTKNVKNETILFEIFRKKQKISENFFNLMLEYLVKSEIKSFLCHKNADGKTAFQLFDEFLKIYELISFSPSKFQQFLSENFTDIEVMNMIKP